MSSILCLGSHHSSRLGRDLACRHSPSTRVGRRGSDMCMTGWTQDNLHTTKTDISTRGCKLPTTHREKEREGKEESATEIGEEEEASQAAFDKGRRPSTEGVR
ncbi:uncharacterized protein [Physcomitrium patens]|uniref:uncharacterized protein isoform X2 n=1 Tax=Physcomitrium patens TaxID=3218 RepID=UPI003CCC8FA6